MKIKVCLTILIMVTYLTLMPSVTKAASCAPAGTATYDDNNLTYIQYFGTWNFLSSPANGSSYQNAIFQTIHGTTDPNAYVRFCFTGSSITKFFSMAYNRGTEYVYIDGTLRSTYSSYAPEVRRQIGQTWELPYGQHTIEIRSDTNTSTSTDIDAFSVDIPTFGYATYDNTSSAIRYSGSSWINGQLSSAGKKTISSSNIDGEVARLTFRGDKLVVAYDRFSDRGLGTITIDGINGNYIDFYDPSRRPQTSRVYSGLGSGIHIATITNNAGGKYIDVDYLTVTVDGYVQIFPRYQIGTNFSGASSYITTPNPYLYEGHSVSLVAVSNYIGGAGLRFIEAGADKDCQNTACGLHPYMSYSSPISGIPTQVERTDIDLTPGGEYLYKIYYIGSNLWRAEFCNPTCITLADRNIGTSSPLPSVFSGGENTISAAIGPSTHSYNKYRDGVTNNWVDWCFSTVINSAGGIISSCTTPYSWSYNNP